MWKQFVFVLLWETLGSTWAGSRDVYLTKTELICEDQLEASDRSFWPVTSAVECARLYAASGQRYMLLRRATDGALWCGYTSVLLHDDIPCRSGTSDISAYGQANVTSVFCSGSYQLGEVNFCLHVTTLEMTREESDQHCSSVGGSLVEIDTPDDLPYLQKVVTQDFHVAADDHQKKGDYKWASGASVNGVFFSQGQPGCNNDRCVAFSVSQGQLYDVFCDKKLQTVCAIAQL